MIFTARLSKRLTKFPSLCDHVHLPRAVRFPLRVRREMLPHFTPAKNICRKSPGYAPRAAPSALRVGYHRGLSRRDGSGLRGDAFAAGRGALRRNFLVQVFTAVLEHYRHAHARRDSRRGKVPSANRRAEQKDSARFRLRLTKSSSASPMKCSWMAPSRAHSGAGAHFMQSIDKFYFASRESSGRIRAGEDYARGSE